jgi:type II secretory pathway component PulF
MSKIKEQIFLMRRMSFLLSSGHSTHQSLMLCSESLSKKWKVKMDITVKKVLEGNSFSKSLRTSSLITDTFSLELIALGDITGSLGGNMLQAAEDLESRRNFNNSLIGSLIYPVLVIIGTVSVTGGLVFFIFPKVMPIFLSMNISLPWSTKLLIRSITFIEENWIKILALSVILVGLLFWQFKKIFYKAPLIKQILISRTLKILGLLLNARLGADEAFNFGKGSFKHPHFKMMLERISFKIKEGRKVSQAMREEKGFFPPLVLSFLDIAEQTGTLGEASLYLSRFYEDEVKLFSKRLSELIEPVLMIFLGLCIGFIGMSLITPIYSITSNVYH